MDPRKSQQTTAVRITASSMVNRISWTASSTSRVPSKETSTKTPGGSRRRTSSRRTLTALATSTALAPRCFLTPSPWAGSPLNRAKARLSSSPSSTTARSRMRTWAPFLSATTSRRNSSVSGASPSARTFTSRRSPSSRPAGSSMCSLLMAARTSAAVSP